jgi:hypothetical protein
MPLCVNVFNMHLLCVSNDIGRSRAGGMAAGVSLTETWEGGMRWLDASMTRSGGGLRRRRPARHRRPEGAAAAACEPSVTQGKAVAACGDGRSGLCG